jgi:hypothetical protein
MSFLSLELKRYPGSVGRQLLNNATFSGSYQGGSLQAVLPGVTVEADSGSPDGNGNRSLFFDTSGPGGPQQGGLTSAITYNVNSKGRSPLTANSNAIGIAYVVIPIEPGNTTAGRVVVLTSNSNPTINDWEQ